MFNNEAQKIIAEFDIPNKVFSENQVFEVLCTKREEYNSDYTNKDFNAEYIAFSPFFDSRKNEKNLEYWLQNITSETVYYWEKRLEEVTHPILKARYAGLLWFFSKKITTNKVSVRIAFEYIDSIFEIADGKLHEHWSRINEYLEDALDLAIRIQDSTRIEKIKNAILHYEFALLISYDLLLNKNKGKITISVDQEKQIITRMENVFNSCSDPGYLKEVTDRLANYYRIHGEKDYMTNVLLKYCDLIINDYGNGEPMRATTELNKAYHLIRKFGLGEKEELIKLKLQEVGKKMNSCYQIIPHTTTISMEEAEKRINYWVDDNLKDCLKKVAMACVLPRAELKKRVDEAARNNSLSSMATILYFDQDGRNTIELKNQEDLIVKQNVMEIQLRWSFSFVRDGIARIFQKHNVTTDKIINYLYQSPIFKEDKKPFIRCGLDAYINNDSIVALHVLTPYFESVIREMLKCLGGTYTKPNDNGGYDVKLLDEMLREDAIEKSITKDLAFYFKTVFTDRRGFNIRNEICHGLSSADFLEMKADLVFLSLLVISQFR